MFAKALASLVVVAALGIGGYTMYTNVGCTGCPFSSSTSAANDCCAAQADCCEPASACCTESKLAKSDCCAAQAECCEPASACCAEGKLAKASVPECCFPGSPCCEGDDCCLKTGAKKVSAVTAVVGVPATIQALKK